ERHLALLDEARASWPPEGAGR
ncbi:hypothetical protein, partial [Algiphilus sp.]